MTIRTKPRRIKQPSNESCWAAALSSWLDAVGDPARKRSVEELLASKKEGDHGLTITGFRNLAAGLGMDTAIRGADQFTSTHLESLLKQSIVFIGFEVNRSWWHDVVLYGVTEPPRDEPSYDVMDPATGEYRTVRKTFFFPYGFGESVLIGWKAVGRAGRLY